ncbi:glucokinase [Erythrobacter sp. SAORIC-644]|jgi:glucokinase|uniref:glucokinase n=1 Tax=Erythrobacter sp. SAORIC-644 TaxID=1869314 RepID=UPI000C66D469|nr:glucokinase [Erythrobacter sp. SAORIC-644]MAQ65147.1 glucokinase [Sphingomonadaceae bacterium]MEC7888793.1 glucokinase [Pseudomonadota bacterium]QPL39594.1 glucokinase [Erythrobacter sp. A30-3]HAG35834.1 glucokinase [Erythrobacter sp.]PNQ77752.1 glucokinase [Erythrobacter sp. SAORIC-644]|tara:strand:- start:362 stop:1333 length:972 start_codon:yes stop_codon:yes gene_type:complete
MELVSVDIGGTHARFAIATVADDGTISLSEPETLHTEDHASFQTAWEDFRGRMGGSLPPRVSMAIAGPVGGDVIRFTNNPWIIRPALVREKLGVEEYCIVNDFEAVAHAVARVDEDQFIHLTGPDKPLAPTGRLSVLGPGTGLGVAHLYREADGTYRVSATEGGHIDFAPLDQIDDAILARLRKRHVRVSVERVVAGPAISDIYQALASMEGRPVAEEDDIAIWKRGQDGSDSLAAAAVDRFCMSLGSVAGDIALAQGGFGGVVIAGGLGYRIRDTLLKSGFSERFKSKGRFQELMASIPVKLIVHPQPGLFGAAAAFVREHP